MQLDPQFRYTRVVLLVEWDPEQHDHPQAWGWTEMLESRAEVLDFEEVEVGAGNTEAEAQAPPE